MRRTLTIFIFLLAFTSSYAQKTQNETKLEFTKQEVFENYKNVYFVFNQYIEYSYFKEIMLDMIDNNIVYEMWLDGGKSCKTKVPLKTTPEDIQVYLKKYGYNFAYETVINKLPTTELNKQKELPAHYPKKINTGNAKQDEKNHFEAISIWRKKYPQEWENFKKSNNK